MVCRHALETLHAKLVEHQGENDRSREGKNHIFDAQQEGVTDQPPAEGIVEEALEVLQSHKG